MLNIEVLKKKNKIGYKLKYQRETKMRYFISPLNNRTYGVTKSNTYRKCL